MVEKVNILQREELFSHLEDQYKRDQIVALINESELEDRDMIDIYWHNDVEGNMDHCYSS